MLPSPRTRGLASGVYFVSRPPVGSLALRPGDSLTIPRMALSIGFRNSVSFLPAIQATRLPTVTSVGLSPTEHASLRWTHCIAKTRSVVETISADSLCSVSSQKGMCRHGFIRYRMNDGVIGRLCRSNPGPQVGGLDCQDGWLTIEGVRRHAARSDGGDLPPAEVQQSLPSPATERSWAQGRLYSG